MQHIKKPTQQRGGRPFVAMIVVEGTDDRLVQPGPIEPRQEPAQLLPGYTHLLFHALRKVLPEAGYPLQVVLVGLAWGLLAKVMQDEKSVELPHAQIVEHAEHLLVFINAFYDPVPRIAIKKPSKLLDLFVCVQRGAQRGRHGSAC